MSEEEDPIKSEKSSYSFDDTTDEVEEPVEGFEQEPIEPVTEYDEIDDERKKKRRRIIIIIFAIIIPVALAVVGLGLLIWGIVVGFTNCCNQCFDCFDTCFGCCNCLENCNNSCNSCTNSCDNCCTSSSVSNESMKVPSFKESIRLSLETSIQLIKWYYYSTLNVLKNLFGLE